jgi:hypothetical protein
MTDEQRETDSVTKCDDGSHDFPLKLPRRSIHLVLFGHVMPGLSPRRSGFYPKPVRVEFVVDKVAMGQDVYRVIGFSLSV